MQQELLKAIPDLPNMMSRLQQAPSLQTPVPQRRSTPPPYFSPLLQGVPPQHHAAHLHSPRAAVPHTQQGQLSQRQAQHQFLQGGTWQPHQPNLLPQASPGPQHQPLTSGFPAASPSSFPQHHYQPGHNLSGSSASSHTTATATATATAQHQQSLYLTVPTGVVPMAPLGYALVPLVGQQGCPAPQLVPPPGFALVPVAPDGSLLNSGAILPLGQQRAPPPLVPPALGSNGVPASAATGAGPSLSNMHAAAQLRTRLAATQPTSARGGATALAKSVATVEATSGQAAGPSGPSAADAGGGWRPPAAQPAAKRKAREPPEALPERSSASPCKRLRCAPPGSSAGPQHTHFNSDGEEEPPAAVGTGSALQQQQHGDSCPMGVGAVQLQQQARLNLTGPGLDRTAKSEAATQQAGPGPGRPHPGSAAEAHGAAQQSVAALPLPPPVPAHAAAAGAAAVPAAAPAGKPAGEQVPSPHAPAPKSQHVPRGVLEDGHTQIVFLGTGSAEPSKYRASSSIHIRQG